MPISDPLLQSKINVYGTEYGVYSSFEASATAMRMRQQDQNIGAYMVFVADMHKRYFSGFSKDGQVHPGFSSIVTEYFGLFPANLHDTLFAEIDDHLNRFEAAVLEGVSMRLNQLMAGESSERIQSVRFQIQSSLEYVQTNERNRLFLRLREIKQERITREQNAPKPTRFDKMITWAKDNVFIAICLAVFATSSAVYGFFKMITELACKFSGVLCG